MRQDQFAHQSLNLAVKLIILFPLYIYMYIYIYLYIIYVYIYNGVALMYPVDATGLVTFRARSFPVWLTLCNHYAACQSLSQPVVGFTIPVHSNCVKPTAQFAPAV